MAGSIHPTAIVHPEAEVSPGAEIGPYCVIGPKVTIGDGTRLMPHSQVIKNTVLGEGNELFPGTIIGADPQDKKFGGEVTWVKIGDRNSFREHVTVNRGTGKGGGETIIGDDCLLMAGAHVAHDCVIGNHVTMANGVQLGGHVVVQDHVGFGGMTAVHHFVTIGRLAFLGGMTRVIRDAAPFFITEGSQCKVRAVNKVGLRRHGFSEDVIAWLKEAYRVLFFEEITREEAFERLAEKGSIPEEGHELLAFLKRAADGNNGRALQP